MRQSIVTFGMFRIDEVLPHIKEPGDPHAIQYFDGVDNRTGETKRFPVDMSSIRYVMYRDLPVCNHCGLKGKFFLLQSLPNFPDEYHFNLYGIEQNEMVMLCSETIDPTQGVSPDNRRTTCKVCQTVQNQQDMPNDILLHARDIYTSVSPKTAMLWVKFWTAAKNKDMNALMDWAENQLGLQGKVVPKRIAKVKERRARNLKGEFGGKG